MRFEHTIHLGYGDTLEFVKPGEGACPVTGRTPENEGPGASQRPRQADSPGPPSKLVIITAGSDNWFYKRFSIIDRDVEIDSGGNETWIYVGEPDAPQFENEWGNFPPSYLLLP